MIYKIVGFSINFSILNSKLILKGVTSIYYIYFQFSSWRNLVFQLFCTFFVLKKYHLKNNTLFACVSVMAFQNAIELNICLHLIMSLNQQHKNQKFDYDSLLFHTTIFPNII